MDLKELKKIINLMKSADISEIEIEGKGKKVRIVRDKKDEHLATLQKLLQSIPHTPAAAPIQAIDVGREGRTEGGKNSDIDNNENFVQVNAPMVGTFYVAPNPDSPAYVRVGDIVKKGDILCVIEAMKLMNEIESEVDGKIVSILVKNAQPVEYGQSMFLIDPQ